jgi:hypothetical protein
MIVFDKGWNDSSTGSHSNHDVDLDESAMRQVVEATLNIPGMRNSKSQPTMCAEIKLLADALATPNVTATPSLSSSKFTVVKNQDRQLKVLVTKGIHQSNSQHFTVQVAAVEGSGLSGRFTYEIFVRRSFNVGQNTTTAQQYKFQPVGISVIVSGITKYWPSTFYSGSEGHERVHVGNSAPQTKKVIVVIRKEKVSN